jgi:putative ABC transport system permease protein
MKKTPPSMFLRFFRWYCHPRLRDHIEGDLMEEYNERIREFGKRNASVRFMVDVLLLFRPGIVRPLFIQRNLNTYGMYKSYFKIGWRNLLKDKGNSVINIGGLALGISVALMIGLWVYDEIHFNEYHSKHARIARVLRNGTLNNETHTSNYQPLPLAEELRAKYGDNFKTVAKAWMPGDHIFSDTTRNVTFRGRFIEPAGVPMLDIKMVQGTVSGLNDPHSVLISASAAKNIFGDETAINKVVKIDINMEAKVVGVYEDLPHNSDFHGTQFLAPFELLISANEWMKYQGFGSNMLEVYVELAEGVSFPAASERIKDAILKNVQSDKSYVSVNPQLFLHPMDDWHLNSEWKNGNNTGGLIQIVWLFAIIGGFVLLLACINFMNLSTARSQQRAKEVGIRKSMGSFRSQLMHQFFSESLLVVVFSFVIALGIVSVSLSWFNDLAGKAMVMPWTNLYVWLGAIAFVLTTGLIAGSYPALYLSSFKAVAVLKGSLRSGRFSSIPRKVLVVFQFTVSVTLIIGTVIVYKQIQFAKNRPAGYSREGLIMIPMSTPEFAPKLATIQTELKNTGTVASVAESSSPPTDVWNTNGGFEWRGMTPGYLVEFATMTVSPEYGKTVGWEFINGRDFSPNLASDSAAFVINEAAAKLMGIENPVGEPVKWNSVYRSKYTSFTIIGMIRDMVMKSPYDASIPAVYFLGSDKNWINVRINPSIPTTDALAQMEQVFKKIVPSAPFDFKFADDEYALKFATEERVGKLASLFTVLAIVISCLGLFGLASFIAEQRTKEIGIRKVVGASVYSLWKMLSVDFVILVIISCVLAIPAAYYFASEWLLKFHYRTDISWWVFFITTITALSITILTVSYQAIRAALMNPVKSLRSE